MRYTDFRDTIARELRRTARGLTWSQLKTRLRLPFDRPCPEWTKQLETEIGLTRIKGDGRSLLWTVPQTKSS